MTCFQPSTSVDWRTVNSSFCMMTLDPGLIMNISATPVVGTSTLVLGAPIVWTARACPSWLRNQLTNVAVAFGCGGLTPTARPPLEAEAACLP